MNLDDMGRRPDQVIVWRTYVLALDDVCRAAGIQVAPGAEIDANLPDKTSIRLVVKSDETA